MLFKIASFELRYQLRSPLFLVGFAIFFLLTFGSVTIDQIQIGARATSISIRLMRCCRPPAS